MEFQINVEGLQGLVDAIEVAGGDATPLLSKAVEAGLQRVQSLAREKAPHRTGTLQRSIQMESSDLFGIVKVNEKYGLYLEEGTGPFDIYPRNKKALFWPGAAHPVKVVHNPGIKARPFFQPAIEEAQPFIKAQFQAVVTTLTRLIQERSAT